MTCCWLVPQLLNLLLRSVFFFSFQHISVYCIIVHFTNLDVFLAEVFEYLKPV